MPDGFYTIIANLTTNHCVFEFVDVSELIEQ